jgi:hypothetical protein
MPNPVPGFAYASFPLNCHRTCPRSSSLHQDLWTPCGPSPLKSQTIETPQLLYTLHVYTPVLYTPTPPLTYPPPSKRTSTLVNLPTTAHMQPTTTTMVCRVAPQATLWHSTAALRQLGSSTASLKSLAKKGFRTGSPLPSQGKESNPGHQPCISFSQTMRTGSLHPS